MTWQPSGGTRLTASFEHFEQEYQADYGTPVIGDRPVRLPVERSFGDPNDPMDHERRTQFGTDLLHRLNDTWAIQHRFLYGKLHGDSTFINPTPAFGEAIRADLRTMDRNVFKQFADQEIYATNLDLTGTLGEGPIRHHLLFGVDYAYGRTLYPFFGDYETPNPALAIDIFNPGPSYGIDPALIRSTLTRASSPDNYSVFKDELYGAYVQDQIDVGSRTHVLIGGRYDQAKTGRGSGPSESVAEDNLPSPLRDDTAFSPRIGALYELTPAVGVYASWSQSFGANNGISSTGESFDPQKGEQYEVGMKAEGFDRRLLTNLALYHLTKTNLLTPDLSTPDANDSIAIGEQRSRGVELDVAGQLNDALSIIASYAYTDAEVTRDNGGSEGRRLPNVPEHALTLWAKYTFLNSSLSGLSLALGGIAQDQREGDLANSFQLPGFARIDAMASYPFKLGSQALVAQFNVRNVFDTQYYESTDPDANVAPRLGVYVGDPRTFIARIKLEF
ncbi:MAG TPA: TonB-dependent receptor [Candidatus Macondimonas sp.]|nr:TonB-dependent receptor [Candidatus Macondimonas sp.]